MSLKPLNASNPLGQFDCLDTDMATIKGGEVCTFVSSLLSGSDLAAKDVFDGYASATTPTRPVLTKSFTTGAVRPLMLADDGITGYGTLFGSVVGGTTGQLTTGTALGPSSLTGSGKLTAWMQPGVFAISLDAVDSNAGGLLPSNNAVTVGSAVYFTAAGLLTTTANKIGTGSVAVGNFIEFATNGSLVTTPNYLVQSLSPRSFTYAVIAWNPPSAS